MVKSFQEILTVEVAKLLMPLKHLDSPQRITAFVQGLGFRLPNNQQLGGIDLDVLIDLVDELVAGVAALVDANTDEEAVEAVLGLTIKIPDVVKAIDTVAPRIETAIKLIPGYVGEQGDLAKLLPRRITEYLLYRYLQDHYGKVFASMQLLGFIEAVPDNNDMPIKTVQWQRIPKLFSEPIEVVNEVYQWDVGPDSFEGEKFMVRFEMLLRAFLIPGGIYNQSSAILTALSNPQGTKEIRMPIYQSGVWPDSWTELDLNMSPIPPEGDKKAGLVLYPYFNAAISDEWEIGDGWKFGFGGNVSTEKPGIGVKLRAPHEVEVKSDLVPSELASLANARLEISLSKASEADDLIYLFGSEEKSHLGLKKVSVKIIVALQNGDAEFTGELDIQDFTISINPGSDADGFLQKILSGINVKSVSNLGLGISNKDGFYFKGSAALSVTFPAHIELGPIVIESALVGLGFEDGGIKLTMGASFSAELGPVSASVKRMGVIIPASFPEDGKGNLGPVQIGSPAFLPPSGAGMVVDAGGVVGGGYLEFDNDNKRYAGILELKFGEIGLVAIGLIATRMPDGSDGFSMLINIGVEFGPPIQLSYGFTLSGVGGLIGIHRQSNVDFLREGLRAKTLDSILFPENPIQNANQVISNLRNAFPIAEGRFVVGPMVKLGWGTPNIITADICVLLDLPSPIRIILLGQVAINLPEKDNAIVALNLDILGVLDFSKKELSFDATIYDSRILTFALFGDSAMRLNWGNQPVFALSMGGFHPEFTPPPAFPSLRRLTLSIFASSKLQLSCKAYQALTPNSLQFGCRVDLYAKYAGAELTGLLKFDTLIYFSPFSFSALMAAGVSVRYKGHRLASVQLALTLSGPTPWHAVGKATLSILIWDVSVRINKTWGESRNTTIPAINPWPKLKGALEHNNSWGSNLGRVRAVENFLSAKPVGQTVSDTPESSETEALLLHPAGGFEIRENVLPLKMKLQLLGNAPVKIFDRFDLQSIHVGDGEDAVVISAHYINEHFARGQFEKLTKSEKLSKPSFEKMPAGVKVVSDDLLQMPDVFEGQELSYETKLINEYGVVDQPPINPFLAKTPWQFAEGQLHGAFKRKNLMEGNLRFKHETGVTKVGIREVPFVIVDKNTMSIKEGLLANGSSKIVADQMLGAIAKSTPSMADDLLVMPAFELEEAA